MIALRNVLVATDFSEPSDAALVYGRELAARFGATLHVLHVTENIYLTVANEAYIAMAPDLQEQIEDGARRELRRLLADTDKSGPPSIPIVLRSSSPAQAIIEYAKGRGIDVIVMGTHGRGGLAHLVMGSVAERVVRLAPCPVLTVRHPEREFVHADAFARVAYSC